MSVIRHSIIRRSLLLTILFVAGHGFYFLLILLANALLAPEGFGRLYTAWVILNVLGTPVSIAALFLSGRFAEAYSSEGEAAIRPLLAQTSARILPWAIGAVVALELAFCTVGVALGIDAIALTILLPPLAMSFLAVEVVRSAFLGMLRFPVFGVSWFGWCAAQCVLGGGALFLTGAPWGCFAGMLIANLLAVAALLQLIKGGGPVQHGFFGRIGAPSLRRAALFCSPMIGFALLNNADVLLAYIVLSPGELGSYAASTVLPKAIVTATQPVAQIVLPMITNLRRETAVVSATAKKAITLASAMALLGFAFLWSASGLACGASPGIRYCDPPMMLILALAAIPMAAMRASIVADLARQHRWIPHLPYLAGILFVVSFAAVGHPVGAVGQKLAVAYMVACWSLPILTGLAKLAKRRWWRTEPKVSA